MTARSAQREVVLELLRQAGPQGVPKEAFLFGTGPLHGRRITQISARIFELERSGYVIDHFRTPESSFVRFVLRAEPVANLPAPLRGESAQLTLLPMPKQPARVWNDPEGAA